jgi:molybdopterin molybdotransferase
MLLDIATALPSEEVALAQSFGRRIAVDAVAGEPVPHFRRSGMDGYAIRAEDTANAATDNSVTFDVVEHIPCGAVPKATITSGTAARIMTGAMLPEGADAVVMLEMTETRQDGEHTTVSVKRTVASGANVSPVGSDVSEGELLLPRGSRIGAAETALLATLGMASVPVYRKPKVALLATGTELLVPDAPLVPGKIRNSNSYMLSAQVTDAGGVPEIIRSVPDRLELLSGLVEELMESYDLLITTGGVSVGDYDIMTDFLYEWGGTLLFNKLMMRPGSPTSAAVRDGKLLFALSGNPGACFAGFELLVRPTMYAMQGDARPEAASSLAVLECDFPKVNAYPRFIRGRRRTEKGIVYASPLGEDRSSRLLPGLGADCFIVIPPGGQGLSKGELVEVLPL